MARGVPAQTSWVSVADLYSDFSQSRGQTKSEHRVLTFGGLGSTRFNGTEVVRDPWDCEVGPSWSSRLRSGVRAMSAHGHPQTTSGFHFRGASNIRDTFQPRKQSYTRSKVGEKGRGVHRGQRLVGKVSTQTELATERSELSTPPRLAFSPRIRIEFKGRIHQPKTPKAEGRKIICSAGYQTIHHTPSPNLINNHETWAHGSYVRVRTLN